MARSRQIAPTAEGKHIGHACEGHARGLYRQIFEPQGFEVLRTFPFDLPVNPDVVVRDRQGRIRLVVIVAYWRNARNSDSKFARTRPEYEHALLARRDHPDRFAPDFKILTLLYGTRDGWKPQVLEDLARQCPPLVFLPDRMDERLLRQVIEDAYGAYRDRWETQGTAAREHVEKVFAEMSPLPRGHRELLELLRAESDRAAPPAAPDGPAPVRAQARVPAPFQTRYRQGLSLLSLFPDAEVRAWRAGPRTFTLPVAPEFDGFVRRALFLDLVALTVTTHRSILHPQPVHRYTATPRRPARPAPFGQGPVLPREYAPDRPDFRGWEEIDQEVVADVLTEHRAHAAGDSQVFRGGAQDQVMGNFRDVAGRWLESLPEVRSAVQAGDEKGLVAVLGRGQAVEAEAWHPARGRARLFPVWDLGLCLCAIARRDRKEWSRHRLRRQDAPTPREARALARVVLALDRPRVLEMLDHLQAFGQALCGGTLADLAGAPRPALLSLDHPCSWVSGWYNNVTTNATHNPLCVLARCWLRRRFPDVAWLGWPARRGEPVSRLIPDPTGRREWQLLGRRAGGDVVAAEVKSITGNNWGNKSKELYDRVSRTHSAADAAGVRVTCVGILDGDFLDGDRGRGPLDELRSGIGYDESYSLREVLAELRQGEGPRNAAGEMP